MKLTLRQNFWLLLGLTSWALFTTLLSRQRFHPGGDLIAITHESALYAVIPSLLLVLIPCFILSRLYRCKQKQAAIREWLYLGLALLASLLIAWLLRNYYLH